jgi:cyclophilin family peptidyl-prolyl cis-trans isomerase
MAKRETLGIRGTLPRVTLKTTKGDIVVELFADKTPKAVENFVGLAKKGYYDGSMFHRAIPDFMIQGGDPQGTGLGGESLWGGTFEDEIDASLKMDCGVIAMANRGPNTNASQFFIVVRKDGCPWLQGAHTVFGRVVQGLEVAEAISKGETDKGRPLEPVTLQAAVVATGDLGGE